jgi:hypothetical protein
MDATSVSSEREDTMKRFAIVGACALVVAGAASLRAEDMTIKKHEQREQHRIDQGEKSGRLTPKESERLQNQQEVIDKERQDAGADGKITKRERRDIRHDQKRLNQDIHHKKHNKQHE